MSTPQQLSSSNPNNRNLRADADIRRQAVIAAAEQRDRKNKARKKPIPKKKGGKAVAELTPEELQKIDLQKEENMKRNAIHMANKPLSEEAKKAVEAAKKDEVDHTNQLGYNPYEVRKVTAGQAATASVAMTHGSIKGGDGGDGGAGGTSTSRASATTRPAATTSSIPAVRPPPDSLIAAEDLISKSVNQAFDEAFHAVVTTNSNEKVPKSLRIMKKLIVNATTSSPDDPKRKVRISEPNNLIQTCIIDINGAFELMMSVGFVLTEAEGKTFLVFDEGMNGGAPSWLDDALEKMEKYQTNS